MLLSTIIPVYKAEKFLPQLLDGLLPQLTNECEVVLVDDGSPDNCDTICDEYAQKDSRVKVIHKKNGGVSSARNAGLDIAKGENITFIDSDDWVSDDYIETVSFCTEKYDLVNFDVSFQLKDKSFVIQPNETKEYDYDSSRYLELLLKKCINSVCSKIYKANIIKENNIKFDENIKIGEDYCFNLEYALYSNTIHLSDKAIYYYRYNEGSATANIDLTIFKDIHEMLLFERKLIENKKLFEFEYESYKGILNTCCSAYHNFLSSGYTPYQIAPYLKKFDFSQIPYSSLSFKEKTKKYLLVNEHFRFLGSSFKIYDFSKRRDSYNFR